MEQRTGDLRSVLGEPPLGSLDAALHATALDPVLPSAVLGFLVGALARQLREKRREADSALRSAG